MGLHVRVWRRLLRAVRSPSSALRTLSWLLRLNARARDSRSQLGPTRAKSGGLENCEIFVINLAHRQDRLRDVDRELKRIGVNNYVRFDAVPHDQGIIGCTESHFRVVQQTPEEGQLLMVCEDDLEFLGSREEIDECVAEFVSNTMLDVLCLAYNVRGKSLRVSDRLSITNSLQTASCYLVKRRALPALRMNLGEAVTKLVAGGSPERFANDIHWKKLQQRELVFCYPAKRIARQRASFSDIENKQVDYGL